jgi:hypothetical protein
VDGCNASSQRDDYGDLAARLPRTQWFVVLAGGAEGIAFTPARNKTGRERIKAGVKRVLISPL